MKQKRKGHIPFWVRPVVWGSGKIGRILWLNLIAGVLLAGIALLLLAPGNFESPGLRTLIWPILLLMLVGFYLAIASAFLIFWGYAEDEERL